MSISKTPGQQCPGVFLWLLFSLWVAGAEAQPDDCPAAVALQWYPLQSVVDGDTLRLADGNKLRVIAINAPELAGRNRAAQPLADQARRAASEFLAGSERVGVVFDQDRRDRYGRLLAFVYRADGQSLSAHLLARGLAWQVVVPPNEAHWRCLRRHEQWARQQGLGVWGAAEYQALPASQLSRQDTGFARVQGVVRAVQRSRSGWWLQLDRLAVQLTYQDMANFEGVNPADWLNQPLLIRGWVIDRSTSSAVQKHGFSPLMMRLRHPAMLE